MSPGLKKGASSPPSLLPIMPRQSSQDSRRVSILRQRRPFAAVRASQVFVPADLHPSRKVDMDDLAHLSVLKSAPSLGTPAT